MYETADARAERPVNQMKNPLFNSPMKTDHMKEALTPPKRV